MDAHSLFAWCDQFRSEGPESTQFANREEMINDTRLLALLPGLAYTSQGGQVLHVNPNVAKPRRGRKTSLEVLPASRHF